MSKGICCGPPPMGSSSASICIGCHFAQSNMSKLIANTPGGMCTCCAACWVHGSTWGSHFTSQVSAADTGKSNWGLPRKQAHPE